jgi:hypothetical protein
MTKGAVQIEEVVSALPSADLWGDFKVSGVDGSRLDILGWTLGAATEVARVEVLAGRSVIASTTPSLARGDLAEKMPDRSSAATCGFQVTIEADGKGRSTLELRAVLEDETTVPMGKIQVFAPARRWDVFRRR